MSVMCLVGIIYGLQGSVPVPKQGEAPCMLDQEVVSTDLKAGGGKKKESLASVKEAQVYNRLWCIQFVIKMKVLPRWLACRCHPARWTWAKSHALQSPAPKVMQWFAVRWKLPWQVCPKATKACFGAFVKNLPLLIVRRLQPHLWQNACSGDLKVSWNGSL